MENRRKTFLDHAALELKLLEYEGTPLYDATLKYLAELWDVCDGEQHVLDVYHNMVKDLINLEPLSELYEHELVEIELKPEYAKEMVRKNHPRCQWVYSENGKFFDERAFGFQKANGNIYYGMATNGDMSCREITFPYKRKPVIIYLGD